MDISEITKELGKLKIEKKSDKKQRLNRNNKPSEKDLLLEYYVDNEREKEKEREKDDI